MAAGRNQQSPRLEKWNPDDLGVILMDVRRDAKIRMPPGHMTVHFFGEQLN